MDVEKLKKEIKAELLKEITQADFHNPLKENDAFNDVRNKFAKNKGPLYEAYGPYTYARVWEHIRALASISTGTRYLRDLTPDKAEKAAKVAKFLCEFMIDKGEVRS